MTSRVRSVVRAWWIAVLAVGNWSDHALADPPRPSAAAVADRLRSPGAGDQPIDWSAVPPWQQTSFFGVRARGQVFVYVVDCSGSMGDDERLLRAKVELRRSVQALRFPQQFYVIFYNDRPLSMPGHIPQSADQKSKGALFRWLGLIDADGQTDPRGAMAEALNLRPDAVFLLSDGEFAEGTADAIAKQNPRKVPIHGIDLSGGAGGDQLKRIAAASGGDYASRP